MAGKIYMVNEMFLSLQGEGQRAGSCNVFVRFAGCNLACDITNSGFDCDTDFSAGLPYNAEQIIGVINDLWSKTEPIGFRAPKVILTGGEPTLQADDELIKAMNDEGMYISIETNGTRDAEWLNDVNYIAVSPKTAEHTLRISASVNELRYVRCAGMPLPKPRLLAQHRFISPAFDASGHVSRETLDWCVDLCLKHPPWRLSMQQHKYWRVR